MAPQTTTMMTTTTASTIISIILSFQLLHLFLFLSFLLFFFSSIIICISFLLLLRITCCWVWALPPLGVIIYDWKIFILFSFPYFASCSFVRQISCIGECRSLVLAASGIAECLACMIVRKIMGNTHWNTESDLIRKTRDQMHFKIIIRDSLQR